LSIVYILIKLPRFGSWIFFRLQVKRGMTETLAVGPPGPGLRLAQPGGPTIKVSCPPPLYLKTEEDPTSETVVVNFIKNIDD
jgi:hypothetical protein